jgi:hypothetical protein
MIFLIGAPPNTPNTTLFGRARSCSFPHLVLGLADPGSDFADPGRGVNAPLQDAATNLPCRRAEAAGGLHCGSCGFRHDFELTVGSSVERNETWAQVSFKTSTERYLCRAPASRI